MTMGCAFRLLIFTIFIQIYVLNVICEETSLQVTKIKATGVFGENATIFCEVSPVNAEVAWKFNGDDIDLEDKRYKIQVTNISTDKDADGNQRHHQISTLSIKETNVSHHGNYSCTVSVSGQPMVQRDIVLDLEIPTKVVQQTMGPVKAEAGSSISLNCVFKGFGLDEVKWRKEDKKLEKKLKLPPENILSSHLNVSHVNGTLKLPNLLRKDNGTYQCGVLDPINKTGVITSIDVLVLDKPQVSIDFVKAVGASKIYLNWTVNDGNLPIEIYTLQYRKNGTETWTYYSTPVGGGNRSFVMTGLDPVTPYQLRISAKNQQGTSQIYTDSRWVVTLDADPQFTPVIMVKGFTVSSVTIGWGPPPETQLEFVHYYELVAQEVNGTTASAKEAIHSGDYRNLPYMFDNLTPATTYVFKVRACSELTRECGAWSDAVIGSTFDGPAGPPTEVTFACIRDVGDTIHADVTWVPPDKPNGKIIRYNVDLTGTASFVDSNGMRQNLTWAPWKRHSAMDTATSARFENMPPNTNFTVSVSAVTRTKRPGAIKRAHCLTPPATPPKESLQKFYWEKVREWNDRLLIKLHMPRVTERNGPVCCYRVVLVRIPREYRVSELPAPEDQVILSYAQAHKNKHGGAYVAEIFSSSTVHTNVILGDGSTPNIADEDLMLNCLKCTTALPKPPPLRDTTPNPILSTVSTISFEESLMKSLESNRLHSNIKETLDYDDDEDMEKDDLVTPTVTHKNDVQKDVPTKEELMALSLKNVQTSNSESKTKSDQLMDQALPYDQPKYTLDKDFYDGIRISHQNRLSMENGNFKESDSYSHVLKRFVRESGSENAENMERILGDVGFSKALDAKLQAGKVMEGRSTQQREPLFGQTGTTFYDSIYDGPLDIQSNYTGFVQVIVHNEGNSLPIYSDYFSILNPGPERMVSDENDQLEFILKLTCGVLGVLLLLGIALCVWHTHRRRKTRQHGAEMHTLHSTLRNLYEGLKGGRPATMHLPPDMPAIPRAELVEAYCQRHADTDLGFQKEFEMLPDSFPDRTMNASEARENQSKNRYPDIKAYDQTRVKLQQVDGIVGSDYINANFVMGYKERKRFICAQGPTDTTVTDFWRMIWEHNLELVVMLTNLEEYSKVKCTKYWPDEQVEKAFGSITVHYVGERRYSDYIVREMRVVKHPPNSIVPVVENNGIEKKNGGAGDVISNSSNSSTASSRSSSPLRPVRETGPTERIVRQYHFLMWKDFVAPEYPQAILKFIRRVNEAWSSQLTRPLLVHCSAGVGRTGTLVALDCLLEQLQAEDQAAIFNTVAELRRQRNFLVQSLKQYVFVYRSLAEHAQYGETEIPASKLKSALERLRHTPEGATCNVMEEEYENVKAVVLPEPVKSCAAGSGEENQAKNRAEATLPYDRNRVILSPVPGRDFSTYINASFIEGYDNSESYIITQDPLPTTIHDFWRMISEQGITTVVMLSELGDGKCPRYWDDGSVQYEHITVDYEQSESCPYYTKREFRVTNNKNQDVTESRQLQYHGWPTVAGQVPEVTRGLTELADAATAHHNEGPMLVHCSLGTERSSMFVALCILVAQLRLERRVDVAALTRKIRSQRAGCLDTFLQYEFLYRAIVNYAELHNLQEDG